MGIRRKTFALGALALTATVLVAASGEPTSAAAEPVAGRLVFATNRYGGEADLATMDAHGDGVARLTYELQPALAPNWSPAGDEVAYTVGTSEESYRTRIVDDAGVTNSGLSGSTSSLVRSPDGDRVAYIALELVEFGHAGGQLLVSRLIVDGPSTSIEIQGQNPANASSPTWSPDGTRLAFADWGALRVVDADGTNLQTLVPDGFVGAPAWSPDGTTIAYAHTDTPNGPLDIFTVPAAGGSPTQLTTDAGDDGSPTWSPDGTHLAFETHRDGNGEIYVMAANGDDPVNLTNDPAEDTAPDWSRACPVDCAETLAPPPGAPPAPTGVSLATEANRQLTVTFDEVDHTWPVEYSVTVSPGGRQVTGSGSPIHIGQLPKGQSYTVTVTTVSDTGTSAPAGPSDPVPLVCPAAPDHGLTDVPPWVEEAVRWAVDWNVVAGYPDDTFRPRLPVTRAQAVSQVYGLLGEPTFQGDIPSVPLVDIPRWAIAPIFWLYAVDVVDGYSDDTFRPRAPVTRAQFARMLHRLAGEPSIDGLDPHGLTDVPAWVDPAVTWLVDAGVLTGYPDHTFRPQAEVTRAEAVRMLFGLECDSPWIGIGALAPLP